jgi:hypothetical protein
VIQSNDFVEEDSDSEEVKISVDSFNGILGKSDFLFDVSNNQVADFCDLLNKISNGDSKGIDEYDF